MLLIYGVLVNVGGLLLIFSGAFWYCIYRERIDERGFDVFLLFFLSFFSLFFVLRRSLPHYRRGF
jgi:hypothetical protein